jgi:membrane-associated phospholipid phosphatase
VSDRFLVRHCGQDLYVRPCLYRFNLLLAATLLFLSALSILLFDARLTPLMHHSGLDDFLRRNQVYTHLVRWPGHMLFGIALALALWRWHPWRAQAAAMVLWASLISGSNWIFKWLAGRPRPDHLNGLAEMVFRPFPGGWAGLFRERNLSMPSGDVSLAFALAATLAWLLPKWRFLFLSVAALVIVERVCENAHHLSDTLAGAALGLLSFHVGHLAATLSGKWTARRLGIAPLTPPSPP